MAPFQSRVLAYGKLPLLEPHRTAVAKSTRSRSSLSSLGKRVQPYLRRFDSYLSNQRPIHESPLSKALVVGDPGKYHPLKRKRATKEDQLARQGQRGWATGRCGEVQQRLGGTYGGGQEKQFELHNSERSPRYEHGKHTSLDDTERTKLLEKLFPAQPKKRSPYSSEPVATPPTLLARFGYRNRLTATLSTLLAPFIDRHHHFLPPEERAKCIKRLKHTPLGDDKPPAVANPNDLDLFKPRGRANRDPHTSAIAPETSDPVRKIDHRATADDNLFIPFVDETEYLPSPRHTPADTHSEYLPSPQLTFTEIPGPENWLLQQPTSTDGLDSAHQSAKMPASTTPTPPPPTTKIPSTTKIILPSKVSKSKSTVPQPLRTQISTHLRTTPALSHLNRTLLLSLKRQNWAHHVRTIARELLVSGRCTTYPEVMAVVLGAATQSLRDSDPDREAKEQKKKRKRVEEGDISDDEFNSDGERVEDEIVNGGMRKKKMVERLLGELREEGVNVDIGVPRAVVEEGVNIVKGALKEVVIYEDA